MGVIVAQRLEESPTPRRRSPEEWAMVKSPAIFKRVARRFSSLDPESPARRRLLARELRSAWGAASRYDYELLALRYAPDVVYEYTPELVTIGLPARVEGREAWVATLKDFNAAWAGASFRPGLVLDLGGSAVVTIGHVVFTGAASGIELELDYCQVFDLSGGIVHHQTDFTDPVQALEAAGLEASLLEELERLAPGEWVRTIVGDD